MGIPLTLGSIRGVSSWRGLRSLRSAFVNRRPWRKAINQAIKDGYSTKLGNHPAHCSAANIQSAFPDDWEKCYSFCVTRNPYDRTVSDYFWRTRGYKPRPSFAEYVYQLYYRKIPPAELGLVDDPVDSWALYTKENRIVVDRVVRYENLADDLSEAFIEAGISWDRWLPKAKTKSRQQRRYRDYYTSKEIEIVEEYFRNEIDMFSYEF